MLRLAGREGDGAIINWLSADDVRTVAPVVHGQGEGKEIVARIFVCPSTDTERVRAEARRAITAYLNVPVYAEFHRWLGRGANLLVGDGGVPGVVAPMPLETVTPGQIRAVVPT